MPKETEFTALIGPIAAMLDWADLSEDCDDEFEHDGRFHATQGDGGFWVQRCHGAE